MRKRKRRWSAGSVLMLALTLTVLVFSFSVLVRLRSGNQKPMPSVPEILALVPEDGANGAAGADEGTSAVQPQPAENGKPSRQDAAPTAEPAEQAPVRARLTAAGTLAIEKSIRQSCYSNDTKVYDFTELLGLLKPEIDGDLNAVFLENLLMDDTKVSELVIPACASEMLKDAGFGLSLSGFPRSWDKKNDGVEKTIAALKAKGISPLGLFDDAGKEPFVIRDVNGIHIALMQYTAGLSASVRKSLAKAGMEWAVPEADPERIAADIARARTAGAEVFAVFLHWGKTGGKTPDKSQTALALQIAESGADVIIGAGSRVPQKAEYLTTADGRQVLCAYCLGTLISDERSSAARMGSYLLHVEFEKDRDKKIRLVRAGYTPTYVWRYRQDSTYYYKCLASDRTPPDGMDSEQVRMMEKTCAAVQSALEGSPVEPR